MRKDLPADSREENGRALAASPAFAAFLAESSADFIGLCDRDFVPVFINQAGLRLVGLASLEEAKRVHVRDFFFPEDQPFIVEEFFPGVLREGQGEVEIRFRHFKTGEALWMVYRVHVLRQDGEAVGLATVSRNITARKRAEEALRLSRYQLDMVFREMADSAPAILWVTDAAMRCTYLSRRWYDYTGSTPERDLGFGWLDHVHPDDLPMARETFQDACERRAPFTMDYRLRRRDGEYRWAVDAGLPRFDEHGAFLGHVGSVIDVHERKLLEQALQEANRAKDEFLATLAHELRNPLAPLRNALQILRLAGGDEALVARTRGLMERQVAQMVRLIDDRDAADSLGMMLEILGADVRVVYDGLEAVTAAADLRPAVVLLDIGMPGLNGYDAARQIRRAETGEAGHRVTLIALTGWGQEEDKRRSREAGFDHHLVKPVSFELLTELLAGLEAAQPSYLPAPG